MYNKDKQFGIRERLKMVTWYIQGLGLNEEQLNKELQVKNINITVIAQPKKKLKGTKN